MRYDGRFQPNAGDFDPDQCCRPGDSKVFSAYGRNGEPYTFRLSDITGISTWQLELCQYLSTDPSGDVYACFFNAFAGGSIFMLLRHTAKGTWHCEVFAGEDDWDDDPPDWLEDINDMLDPEDTCLENLLGSKNWMGEPDIPAALIAEVVNQIFPDETFQAEKVDGRLSIWNETGDELFLGCMLTLEDFGQSTMDSGFPPEIKAWVPFA